MFAQATDPEHMFPLSKDRFSRRGPAHVRVGVEAVVAIHALDRRRRALTPRLIFGGPVRTKLVLALKPLSFSSVVFMPGLPSRRLFSPVAFTRSGITRSPLPATRWMSPSSMLLCRTFEELVATPVCV